MKNINTYQTVQYFLLVLTLVVCWNINRSEEPSKLFFLPYVNLVSLQATIGLLLLVFISKLNMFKEIIKNDKKNLLRIFYSILFIYVISSPWVFNYFSQKIGEKSNNILGVLALGLALATDTIATDILNLILIKYKKRFSKRYPEKRFNKEENAFN